MTKLFSIRPSLTLQGREFRGLRGWAGKPLHPPLTDFPIVCYMLAAVFDVISYFGAESGLGRNFFVAATYVMVAGALVSLATALTGFWDWWKGMEREPSSGFPGRAKHTQVWRTANWHMTVMLAVTGIVIADIVARFLQYDEGSARLATMILSLLAGVLVAYGAVYGGSLVYDYQFNVESLEGSTAWDETETDQMPGDKTRPR
ncbi:MAG TPA: DUF2231 domain-containing protein [Candidatus Eisenbacteria bacterium]|nr:DUF2231 domain-containing protein [Candidatus Eisenbacteria bacterium]